MHVLVVGGAGYIGSVTTDLLLESGHEVTVLDSLATGHRAAINKEARFVHLDLADHHALDLAFEAAGVDAVMHFGALIQVGESMTEPGRYFANNISNVIGLLNAMVRHGVHRFVFSSTAAVYAEPPPDLLTEEAPTGPTSPYGETKLAVERLLPWYNQIHGVRHAILRYFNAAGATELRGEDHRPESHLIPNVLKVARGDAGHLDLYGTDYPTVDGTCMRDYIHVADLAGAHLLALGAMEDQPSILCNLGTDNGHSVRQVIDAARRVTGRPIEIVEQERRAGDAVTLVASSERARSVLGWSPKRASLEEIVGSAWDWMQRNPDGYPD